MQHRADDVERHEAEQDQADEARRGRDWQHVRQQVAEARQQGGIDGQDEAAEQHRAEDEGERAEGHQHPDLARSTALRAIGAIADHGAGKHRGADIVRQRIGGERRDRR